MATSNTKPIPALRIVSCSPMGAFRRAGRAWPPEPTVVPVKQFTKEQLAALRAEPMLVVTETEMSAADLAALGAASDDE